MKAIQIVKYGDAHSAFKMVETEKPQINSDQVLIENEVSGLNFADVVARLGLYAAAPPLPSIVGYDVVGKVVQIGKDVKNVKIGDRVTAMTRFGGYAQYSVTNSFACAKIPESVDAAEACALTTQYCTAHFAAEESVKLYKGDKVLIHAAAGGVGTALVQIAKHHECEIFATVGSDEKVEYLKKLGIQHPINYRKQNFSEEIKRITGEDSPIDVIFDAVGGSSFSKGFKLLNAGGRIVAYGAAEMTDAKNVFSRIIAGLKFGIYHPAQWLMPSKSLIGINMLAIADKNPKLLQRILDAVADRYQKGIYKPVVAKKFKADNISEAHEFLQNRKSVGKIVIEWS